MKRLLVFCFSLLSTFAGAVAGEAIQHRGIWLHPEQYKTPELAREWIAKIAAARLNAIYPLVWHRGGTAWFRSKLSPMEAGVPEGFDPLGNLVHLAHERGIAVHAWFVNGSYGAPAAGGVFEQHPQWQLNTADSSDAWFDLGKPEVRQFEHDVMLECLRNYEVDGLHFDYIRYSGQVICFCDQCQKEFADKYGYRPQTPSQDRFPALLEVGANPLDKPTTAQVLAAFDHGVPALAVNRLEAGETVLVNWQAASSSCLALRDFLKSTLQRFGAASGKTFQLHTTQTAARYAATEQEKARHWLKDLGFPAKQIDETGLATVPHGATIVLAGQYLIAEETAAGLERFVRAGGHCLFVDGPVFAIKQEPLRRVLGMQSTAKFFHDWKVISPVAGQDVLQAGPPVDAAKERMRTEKWVEYRKWTVSELVRKVHASAKSLKPQSWVSAAVFFKKDSADKVCQDWYGWLREGCIDYVLPMAYTEDNAVLEKAFTEWREFDPRMERIIPGLSIYSRREGKAGPRDLALVRSQLGMCRDHETHGNLFFSLAYLNEDLIQLLAGEVFTGPAEPWYPPAR